MAAVILSERARPRRREPIRWPWIAVAMAWGMAGLALLTNHAYLVDHHQLLAGHEMRMFGHYMRMGGLNLPWPVALIVFLASWQVMTLAMMLPSSLPMVCMMIHASRGQARRRAVQAAFLAGYAGIWTAFALAAFTGDMLVHVAENAWPWLADRPWLIAAATLAIAGAFQFSALKARCLKNCRNPVGFFVRYYRRGVIPAWQLGIRHGMFCLGCCWALMLLMFGVGMSSLAGMAALAGVMVVEKTAPGGQRLGRVVGAGLLIWGGLVLWQPAWLPAALAGAS